MKYKLSVVIIALLLLSGPLQAKTTTKLPNIATVSEDDSNPFLNAITGFVDWIPALKTKLAALKSKAVYGAVYEHLGLIAADLDQIADAKSGLQDIIDAPDENKKEIKDKITFIFTELTKLKDHLVGINDDISQSDHPENAKWLNPIKSDINAKIKSMKQFKLYLVSNDGKLDKQQVQLDSMKKQVAKAIVDINVLRAEIKPLK
jgi:chromosome segregation ATPase